MATPLFDFGCLVVVGEADNALCRQLTSRHLPFTIVSNLPALRAQAIQPDEIILINVGTETGAEVKADYPDAQVIIWRQSKGQTFAPELFVVREGNDIDCHYYDSWDTLIQLISHPLPPQIKPFRPSDDYDWYDVVQTPAPDSTTREVREQLALLFHQLSIASSSFLRFQLEWLKEVEQQSFSFHYGRKPKGKPVKTLDIPVTRNFTYKGAPVFQIDDTLEFLDNTSVPLTARVVEIDEETMVVAFEQPAPRAKLRRCHSFRRLVSHTIIAKQQRCCDDHQEDNGDSSSSLPLRVLAGWQPNDGYPSLPSVYLERLTRRLLYDDAQSLALLEIVGPRPVVLIEGGGGSGKTSVTAVGIEQFWRKNYGQGRIILVIGHSNAGLDVAVKATAVNLGKYDSDHIFRLGNNLQAVTPLAQPWHRQVRFAAELEADAYVGMAGKKRKNPEVAKIIELLENGENVILACTMSSFLVDETLCQLRSHFAEQMQDLPVEVAFIDEATRGFFFELLPILQVVKGKVVFIGDHHQLGNIRLSEFAATQVRTDTDWETLQSFQNGLFVTLTKSQLLRSVLLDKNRRSLRILVELFNRLFYKGKIKPGRFSVDSDGEIILLDTSQAQNRADQRSGTSYRNYRHANLVVDQVVALVKAGVPLTDIGVITPYRSHISLIRTKLRKDLIFRVGKIFKDPEQKEAALQAARHIVATVDAFQGSERPVIILDFVRSNGQGDIGFNRAMERLTVSLTRVKDKLIIIANTSTFLECPFAEVKEVFQQLLDFVKQQGRYIRIQ